MSSSALPRHADLRKLAAASARLAGNIGLADLPRLQPLLLNADGVVSVSLELDQDDEGYRRIAGRIAARVAVQCQRCLGALGLDLDVPVSLAMVWSEKEIPSLPSRYEGVVVGPDSVDLYEMMEEELLLALPLVGLHEAGACRAGLAPAEQRDSETSARRNPFAVLRGEGSDTG